MEHKKKKKTTSDGLAIIQKEFYDGKPDQIASLEKEKLNVKVAMSIQQLRTKAGLTQGELANAIGTSRTVISRLECSDYDGHTLKMLHRIASVLDNRIEFKFVPVRIGTARRTTTARSTRRTAAKKKTSASAKKKTPAVKRSKVKA